LIVFKKTKCTLKVANLQAADGPAGDLPPEEHIVMTSELLSNYSSFRVCLILAATGRTRKKSAAKCDSEKTTLSQLISQPAINKKLKKARKRMKLDLSLLTQTFFYFRTPGLSQDKN
jgi:hypothetical protein